MQLSYRDTPRLTNNTGPGNGEIIAVSEAHETKASTQHGIESVKKNAPDAAVVDLRE